MDDRDDVVGIDLDVEWLPRRPVATVHELAIEMPPRLGRRPRDDVEDVDGALRARRLLPLVVHPRRLETSHAVEVLEIVAEGVLGGIGRDVGLHELALEALEERRLVEAELGLDPVLRADEDLPVGLPDAVLLHPVPLDREVGVDQAARLEVEQGPLHEELDRAERLDDPRGRHARAHLDVDEIAAVEIVRGPDRRVARQLGLGKQVGDECVALLLAKCVADRLGDLEPLVGVVARLGSLLDLRGLRLVEAVADPAGDPLRSGADRRDEVHHGSKAAQRALVAEVLGPGEVERGGARQVGDVGLRPARNGAQQGEVGVACVGAAVGGRQRRGERVEERRLPERVELAERDVVGDPGPGVVERRIVGPGDGQVVEPEPAAPGP